MADSWAVPGTFFVLRESVPDGVLRFTGVTFTAPPARAVLRDCAGVVSRHRSSESVSCCGGVTDVLLLLADFGLRAFLVSRASMRSEASSCGMGRWRSRPCLPFPGVAPPGERAAEPPASANVFVDMPRTRLKHTTVISSRGQVAAKERPSAAEHLNRQCSNVLG